MKVVEEGPSSTEAYSLFENIIRARLLSLKLPPQRIQSNIKHMDLPTFSAPMELFEVEADFPGAACFLNFGESVIHKGLYFCQAELRRGGEPTLFFDHYLAGHKDHRQEFLHFTVNELGFEAGIARIIDVLVALLNDELLPVLEGRAWVTAPLHWGPYK